MMYGAITFNSTLEIPSTPEEPLFFRCCIVFKIVFVSTHWKLKTPDDFLTKVVCSNGAPDLAF